MTTEYIKDQPEQFPGDERTVQWIGLMMDKYAAAWHMQWIRGTMSELHPKTMSIYVNALTLLFENKEAKDNAYCDLEKVRYVGCIGDMFTQIQVYNDKAQVCGAALKKIILDRLPQKILDYMHTPDLYEKRPAKK
jgi:hypothetical protein